MKSSENFRLEERVLFEAGAAIEAAAADQAAQDAAASAAEAAEASENAEAADSEAWKGVEASGAANENPAEFEDLSEAPGEDSTGVIAFTDAPVAADFSSDDIVNTPAGQQECKELVVINSSVADSAKIVNDLDANFEILRLEAGTDALDTINDYLDEHADTKYSAIHIVSHGNDGYFTLNGEKIDSATLNPADWKAIGEHLTDGADILVYGCDTAKSEEGKALVHQISALTGADVAASTDTTGANGNWDLEYQAGLIESATLQPAEYTGRLAGSNVTVTIDGENDFAELKDAIAEAAGGGTITFTVDTAKLAAANMDTDGENGNDSYGITIDETLVITGNITIDGWVDLDGDNTFDEGERIVFDGAGARQIMTGSTANVALTLKNLTFQNGYTTNKSGAALAVSGSDTNVTIENVKFYKNNLNISESKTDGSALYQANGKLAITDSEFRENTVTSKWNTYGGALALNGVEADITRTDFIQNTVTSSQPGVGGALLIKGDSSDVEIIGGSFEQNSASHNGGAIYVAAGTVSVNGTQFQGNSANAGGAIYAAGGILTLDGAEFLENHATANGGAVYVDPAATASIYDTTFKGNYAGEYVNGVFTADGTQAGGAIYGYGTNTGSNGMIIANSTFYDNKAAYGGAIFMDPTDYKGLNLTIVNTTVAGNYATKMGGGLLVREALTNQHAYLLNSIILGNTSGADSADANDDVTYIASAAGKQRIFSYYSILGTVRHGGYGSPGGTFTTGTITEQPVIDKGGSMIYAIYNYTDSARTKTVSNANVTATAVFGDTITYNESLKMVELNTKNQLVQGGVETVQRGRDIGYYAPGSETVTWINSNFATETEQALNASANANTEVFVAGVYNSAVTIADSEIIRKATVTVDMLGNTGGTGTESADLVSDTAMKFTVSDSYTAVDGWTLLGFGIVLNSTDVTYTVTANDDGTYTLAGDTVTRVLTDGASTLYAVWGKDITVTCSTAAEASESSTITVYNCAETFTVEKSAADAGEWNFAGWNTDSMVAETVSSTIFNTADYGTGTAALNLYAVYSRTVSITYNANGGAETDPVVDSQFQYRNYNGTVVTDVVFTLAAADTFTKTGYACNGWDTDAAVTVGSYKAGDSVTAGADGLALNLYAIWEVKNDPILLYTVTVTDGVETHTQFGTYSTLQDAVNAAQTATAEATAAGTDAAEYLIKFNEAYYSKDAARYTITVGSSSEMLATLNINAAVTITIDGDVDGNGIGDITFDGNHTAQIMKLTNGMVTLENLTFKNGSAKDGGAIELNGSSNAWAELTIKDSTFDGNHATSNGGAISGSSNYNKLLVQDSVFINNYAGTYVDGVFTADYNQRGGAIYSKAAYTNANFTIANSTFYNNKAAYGGAIARIDEGSNSTNGNLVNVTVAGNHATKAGGGVLFNVYFAQGANVYNSILLGNTSGDSAIADDWSIIKSGSSSQSHTFNAHYSIIGSARYLGYGTIGNISQTVAQNKAEQPAIYAQNNTQIGSVTGSKVTSVTEGETTTYTASIVEYAATEKAADVTIANIFGTEDKTAWWSDELNTVKVNLNNELVRSGVQTGLNGYSVTTGTNAATASTVLNSAMTVGEDTFYVVGSYDGPAPDAAPETATIQFDINSGSLTGSGSMADLVITEGTDYTDLTTDYALEGWTFLGFSTNPNATSAAYTVTDGKYSLTAEQVNTLITDGVTTLYAIWSKDYRVTFHEAGTAARTETFTVYNGNTAGCTLSAADMTQTDLADWNEKGWSVSADSSAVTYANGAEATITDSLTLFAVYDRTVTLNYSLNYDGAPTVSDTASDTQIRVVNTADPVNLTVLSGDTFTRGGYTFKGWSETKTGTAISGSTITISGTDAASKTLYALWEVEAAVSQDHVYTVKAAAAGDTEFTTLSAAVNEALSVAAASPNDTFTINVEDASQLKFGQTLTTKINLTINGNNGKLDSDLLTIGADAAGTSITLLNMAVGNESIHIKAEDVNITFRNVAIQNGNKTYYTEGGSVSCVTYDGAVISGMKNSPFGTGSAKTLIVKDTMVFDSKWEDNAFKVTEKAVIQNSVFSGNTFHGSNGFIAYDGEYVKDTTGIYIDNTKFFNNNGRFFQQGAGEITNTVISGGGNVGQLFEVTGTNGSLTIRNTVISDVTTTYKILNALGKPVTIENSTIVHNTAGESLFQNTGTGSNASNSIIGWNNGHGAGITADSSSYTNSAAINTTADLNNSGTLDSAQDREMYWFKDEYVIDKTVGGVRFTTGTGVDGATSVGTISYRNYLALSTSTATMNNDASTAKGAQSGNVVWVLTPTVEEQTATYGDFQGGTITAAAQTLTNSSGLEAKAVVSYTVAGTAGNAYLNAAAHTATVSVATTINGSAVTPDANGLITAGGKYFLVEAAETANVTISRKAVTVTPEVSIAAVDGKYTITEGNPDGVTVNPTITAAPDAPAPAAADFKLVDAAGNNVTLADLAAGEYTLAYAWKTADDNYNPAFNTITLVVESAVPVNPIVVTATNDTAFEAAAVYVNGTGYDGVAGISLREALHAAVNGDTITFSTALGSFTNDTNSTIKLDAALVLNKNITINGDLGNGSRIILDGSKLNNVVIMEASSATKVTLTNLEFRNGTQGAFYSKGAMSNLEITNVVFANNTASGSRTVSVETSAELTANWDNVLFDGNTGNGAFKITTSNSGSSTVTIRNSAFVNNSTDSAWGGAGNFAGALTATISNSLFQGNETKASEGNNSGAGGGAIHVDSAYVDLIITDSVFTKNISKDYGGALNIYTVKSVTITGSTFAENSAASYGSYHAVYKHNRGGTVSIENSTFVGSGNTNVTATNTIGASATEAAAGLYKITESKTVAGIALNYDLYLVRSNGSYYSDTNSDGVNDNGATGKILWVLAPADQSKTYGDVKGEFTESVSSNVGGLNVVYTNTYTVDADAADSYLNASDTAYTAYTTVNALSIGGMDVTGEIGADGFVAVTKDGETYYYLAAASTADVTVTPKAISVTPEVTGATAVDGKYTITEGNPDGVTVNPTVTVAPDAPAPAAGDFKLVDADGNTVTLADLAAGTHTLKYAWSTAEDANYNPAFNTITLVVESAVPVNPIVVTATNDTAFDAAAVYVNGTGYDGVAGISLREALHAAVNGETITFSTALGSFTNDTNSTIELDAALVLNKNITINGLAGGIKVTLDGQDKTRIATLTADNTVTLRNLQFTGGNPGVNGGAIYQSAGELVIADSVFTGNTLTGSVCGSAVGMYGNADCVIVNSVFYDNNHINSTWGGTIWTSSVFKGNLYLISSTVVANSNPGGTLKIEGGTAYVLDSVIAGNSVTDVQQQNSGTIIMDSSIYGTTAGVISAGSAGTNRVLTATGTAAIAEALGAGASADNSYAADADSLAAAQHGRIQIARVTLTDGTQKFYYHIDSIRQNHWFTLDGSEEAALSRTDTVTYGLSGLTNYQSMEWISDNQTPVYDDTVKTMNVTIAENLNVDAGTNYTVIAGVSDADSGDVLTGYKVTYSKTMDGTFAESRPEYDDSGDYTLYYQVTLDNYTTVRGSVTITINEFNEASGLAYTKTTDGVLTYYRSIQLAVNDVADGGTDGTVYVYGTDISVFSTISITGDHFKNDTEKTITIKGIGDGAHVLDGGGILTYRADGIPGGQDPNTTGLQILKIGSGVDVTIEGLTFTGGGIAGKTNGGAIATTGNLTVKNSVFTGNSGHYGGAVFQDGGTLVVEDSVFSGNYVMESDGVGAAICSQGASSVCYVVRSQIYRNNAEQWGGVLATKSAARMYLISSVVVDNDTYADGQNGGVVKADASNSEIYILNSVVAGSQTAKDIGGQGAVRADSVIYGGANINVSGNTGSDFTGTFDSNTVLATGSNAEKIWAALGAGEYSDAGYAELAASGFKAMEGSAAYVMNENIQIAEVTDAGGAIKIYYHVNGKGIDKWISISDGTEVTASANSNEKFGLTAAAAGLTFVDWVKAGTPDIYEAGELVWTVSNGGATATEYVYNGNAYTVSAAIIKSGGQSVALTPAAGADTTLDPNGYTNAGTYNFVVSGVSDAGIITVDGIQYKLSNAEAQNYSFTVTPKTVTVTPSVTGAMLMTDGKYYASTAAGLNIAAAITADPATPVPDIVLADADGNVITDVTALANGTHTLQYVVKDGPDANYNFSSSAFTVIVGSREDGSLVVTTTADKVDEYDGVTSLREAITALNNDTSGALKVDGKYTITFSSEKGFFTGAANSTIKLDSTLQITRGGENITINGLVSDANGNGVWNKDEIRAVLDGGTVYDSTTGAVTTAGVQIMSLTAQNELTLKNLQFKQGFSPDDYSGAIYCNASAKGTLSIENSAFNSNTGVKGGAVYAHEGITLKIKDSTFTDNTATNGGAIYINSASGSLIFSGTNTLKNNSVGGSGFTGYAGGAVYTSGSVTVVDGTTTFDGNKVIVDISDDGNASSYNKNSSKSAALYVGKDLTIGSSTGAEAVLEIKNSLYSFKTADSGNINEYDAGSGYIVKIDGNITQLAGSQFKINNNSVDFERHETEAVAKQNYSGGEGKTNFSFGGCVLFVKGTSTFTGGTFELSKNNVDLDFYPDAQASTKHYASNINGALVYWRDSVSADGHNIYICGNKVNVHNHSGGTGNVANLIQLSNGGGTAKSYSFTGGSFIFAANSVKTSSAGTITPGLSAFISQQYYAENITFNMTGSAGTPYVFANNSFNGSSVDNGEIFINSDGDKGLIKDVSLSYIVFQGSGSCKMSAMNFGKGTGEGGNGVTLDHVTVTGYSATNGSVLNTTAKTVISDSLFCGNSGNGAVYYNGTDLTLENCTIVENTGGGVLVYPGTANLTVTDSIIGWNTVFDVKYNAKPTTGKHTFANSLIGKFCYQAAAQTGVEGIISIGDAELNGVLYKVMENIVVGTENMVTGKVTLALPVYFAKSHDNSSGTWETGLAMDSTDATGKTAIGATPDKVLWIVQDTVTVDTNMADTEYGTYGTANSTVTANTEFAVNSTLNAKFNLDYKFAADAAVSGSGFYNAGDTAYTLAFDTSYFTVEGYTVSAAATGVENQSLLTLTGTDDPAVKVYVLVATVAAADSTAVRITPKKLLTSDLNVVSNSAALKYENGTFSKVYDGTKDQAAGDVTLSFADGKGALTGDTLVITQTGAAFTGKDVNTENQKFTISGISLGNDNYMLVTAAGDTGAATSVTYAGSISAKKLTLSGDMFGTTARDYNGDTDFKANTTFAWETGMLVSSESLDLTYTATLTSKDAAASSTVTFGGFGITDSNYELTNSDATFTRTGELVMAKEVTLSWGTTSFVYNGKAQKPVATVASGLVTGESLNVAVSPDNNINVGSNYIATAMLEDNGTFLASNYRIAAGNETRAYEITAYTDEIVVTITGHSKTDAIYNGTEQSVSGYDVSSSNPSLYTKSDFTFSGTGVAKGTDAGTYNMNLNEADFMNTSSNFSNVKFVIAEDGKLTINQAQATLSDFTIGNLIYNGGPVTTGDGNDIYVTASGVTGGTAPSGGITYTFYSDDTYQTVISTPVNAGTYYVKAVLAGDKNYFGTEKTASFEIDRAAVTVTADAQTKVYGDTDPALTYTATGLVGTDTLSGGLERVTGENAGAYAITQGTLTNENNANYAITFVGADLTITAKAITVTADAQTKVYGDTDPALTYTATGLVGTDTLSGGLERAEGENVGEYDITLGTLANDNYAITFTGAKLTVTARPITVKADDIKIDTGKDPVFTYTYVGELVGNDAFTGDLASEGDGSKPGEFDITQGTLTLGGNYAITFIGGTLTVEGGGQDANQFPNYSNPGNSSGMYKDNVNSTDGSSYDHHDNVPTLTHQDERSTGFLFSVSNRLIGTVPGMSGSMAPQGADVDIHAHTLSDLLRSYDKSEQIIASPANTVEDAPNDMKDLDDFSNNPFDILPDDEDLHTRAYGDGISFTVIGEDNLTAVKADAQDASSPSISLSAVLSGDSFELYHNEVVAEEAVAEADDDLDLTGLTEIVSAVRSGIFRSDFDEALDELLAVAEG